MTVALQELLARVSFVEVTAANSGRAQVKLAFADEPRATVSLVEHAERLVLTADVPEGGSVLLTPQKGVGGSLASLSEMKVDDAAVDAAWVIRGEDAPLVLALVPELKVLAALAPSIVIEGARLTIRVKQIDDAALPALIEDALAVWHRAVFFRMGA